MRYSIRKIVNIFSILKIAIFSFSVARVRKMNGHRVEYADEMLSHTGISAKFDHHVTTNRL